MKVGIAGTGRMGAAIAQRLMERGHELTVWNRTPEKTKALGGTLPAAETALKCFEEAARSGQGAQDQSVLPARWANSIKK